MLRPAEPKGGSMTSKPVSELMIDLGISRSHSRPRCSNDNPYSEAQFKTLKYMPDFPDRFGSLADARAFCERFFTAYNHEHRHSTPQPRFRRTVRPPSTALTRRPPSGSPAGPDRRACPSRRGSTSPSFSQTKSDQLSQLT